MRRVITGTGEVGLNAAKGICVIKYDLLLNNYMFKFIKVSFSVLMTDFLQNKYFCNNCSLQVLKLSTPSFMLVIKIYFYKNNF